MKIHPLHHGVSYHPPVSSFFFLCSFIKITRGGVAFCLFTQTAARTRDIISYAPTINTIERHNIFVYFITS